MGGTPDKEAVREEAPESAEEPGNARALPDDSQRRRGLSEDGEAKATSDEAPSASQLQASAAAVASSAQSGDAEGEAGSDDASLTLQVVTLDAERFSVRASRNWSVSELKASLADRSGIPAAEQRLVTGGRVLSDGESLGLLGFGDGATLHLLRNATSLAPPNGGRQVQSRQVEQTASPFGLPSPFGGRGGGADDNFMRQMLSSPLMQQILENTDFISALVDSSPQLQALREVHPEINQVLSDPELLRQSIDMMRNPALWRELMRNTDRAMANVEAHPEGFNLLRRFYRGVQEPIHNAAVDVVSGLTGSASGSGEGGLDWSDLQMASDEDTQEMPNPWASREGRTTSRPSASWGVASHSDPSPRRSRGLVSERPAEGSRLSPPPPPPDFDFLNAWLQQASFAGGAGALRSAGLEQTPATVPPSSASEGAVANEAQNGASSEGASSQQTALPPLSTLPTSALQPSAPTGLPPPFPSSLAWPSPSRQSPTGTPPVAPLERSFSGLSLEGVLSQQAAQTASFAATSAEGESGAAAAPNFPSQQTYGEQLAALSSMGFSNREECLEALRRAGGNLNRALDFLLTRTQGN